MTSTKPDIEQIRKDFPLLSREVNGKPLVYLDNGATAQKPKQVIDAISGYYELENANVHRGVHFLSQLATDKFEAARELVRGFMNAPHLHEVIFTRGTTEAINLVAYSFCKAFLKPGDEILISAMEHHSNIVPWQLACEDRGATLKVIPYNEKGELIQSEYEKLLTDKVKLVSVVHISNALGTINPVKEMIRKAHEKNIPVMVDGAQAAPHLRIDVQDLDADFYCFSGHKVFGPTGIGVLYGKEKWLNAMPPYHGGGEMIKTVSFEKTTYNELPHKFEAGTPDIAGVIGLGEAIKYINSIGIETIGAWEHELLEYATEKLLAIPGLKIIGTAENKASVISFIVEGIHPYDIGVLVDKMGVAIRTGHHCAQPIMDQFCIPGTARASFAFYNTKDDVDRLVSSVTKAVTMLS
ncbi:MAG: cysteine desulfurase [Bacteroidota bacterium]